MMKTIKDIKLDGKTVLVSVDYNVPGDKTGQPTDDFRVKCSLPTLNYLLGQGCKIVLISHRDRPGGKVVPSKSLEPVAKVLEKLIKRDVIFVNDCIGKQAAAAKKNLEKGQILLLENTRFHPEEEANDSVFAKELAVGVDVFVQEAFGNVHRKHASTYGVAQFLPSVAGLLVAKEVKAINDVMKQPKKPLMAVIGGAKITDKIGVIEAFIKTADIVAIGGAMANTFLLAQKQYIGKSLVDKDDLPLAKRLIELAEAEAKKRTFIFYLPQDCIVATSVDAQAKTRIVDFSAHVIASVENYPKQPPRKSGQVADNELILDIGPFSGAFIAGSMQLCNTVVWNGAMGVTETAGVQGPVGPFSHGTELLVEAMLGQFGHKPYSLVGGGDTTAYLSNRGLTDCFNHVSTGGGACLDQMVGKKLPGVEVLQDK